MPPLTPAEFEVLAARTGIPLTDALKPVLPEVLPAIDGLAK